MTIQPGGPIAAAPAAVGKPILRWASRARTVDGVASELAKIWGSISLTTRGRARSSRWHKNSDAR